MAPPSASRIACTAPGSSRSSSCRNVSACLQPAQRSGGRDQSRARDQCSAECRTGRYIRARGCAATRSPFDILLEDSDKVTQTGQIAIGRRLHQVVVSCSGSPRAPRRSRRSANWSSQPIWVQAEADRPRQSAARCTAARNMAEPAPDPPLCGVATRPTPPWGARRVPGPQNRLDQSWSSLHSTEPCVFLSADETKFS